MTWLVRRTQARDAVLTWGVVAAPRADDQVHLHERHRVFLNQPDRETVGELLLLDGW